MLASRDTLGLFTSKMQSISIKEIHSLSTSRIQYPTLISMPLMLDKLQSLVKKGRAFSSLALLNLKSVLNEHLNVKLDLQ